MQIHLTPQPGKGNIPVYAGSRIVGTVEGSIFRKTISGSKHFFRNPPGIGSDISALQDAAAAGASLLQVLDRETENVYSAQIKTVYEKGIERDYGFGRQVILPFRYWNISKAADQPIEQLAFAI
jgi:hypothetical protein